MFTNGVLFNAGGISFTLVKCFFAGAAVLGVVTALLFAFLFKRTHGVVKRMSPDEAARAAVYGMGQSWDDMRDPVVGVKAIGATGRSVEISFDIDGLRNAYRSGDRKTFWLAPIMFTCWGSAFWLTFIAAMILGEVPVGLQVMITVILFLFIAVPWFMVWAAVNTNIDLGKAISDNGNESTAAPNPPPGSSSHRPPR